MHLEIGKVEQVDRISRVIHCQGAAPPGGGQPIRYPDVRYYGEPPWPLATVELLEVSPGKWRCLGPIGHREVIMHEDFAYYFDTGDDEWQQFDHPWTLDRPGAAGVLQNSTDFTGDGSAALSTGATTGTYMSLRKRSPGTGDGVLIPPTVPAGAALWLRATVRAASTSAQILQVALANQGAVDGWTSFAAGDRFVGIRSDTSVLNGNWALVAAENAATIATVDSGLAASSTALDTIDIMLSAGQWAAAWITRLEDVFDPQAGSTVVGPLIIEDTRLAVGSARLHPTAGVYPRSNSQRSLIVTRIEAATVAPVIHPTRDLILGQSGVAL